MEDANNENQNVSDRHKNLFCQITRKITGISYENIEKKWLHGNTYKYIANLITNALNANIELTVKIESEEKFEVSDITCHFVNVKKCYIIEIKPWVQIITRMKNFTFLTSAISEYNEKSIVRQKLLDSLKCGKYAYYEECVVENGGFYVHLHSPKNTKYIYLTFQWSVLFSERTWQIGHYFIVNPTENGLMFAQRNESLLQKFDKKNATREELHSLWSELCSALDLCDNENQDETTVESNNT
ncbi:uncharacterized protein LOC143424490 [Xylocopa sonorina]|uniref:uncharacterized protein LOC143424490 n=1 Tax=Xylocopa sonorina TaxID=1818115 RepID=UPI00403B318B